MTTFISHVQPACLINRIDLSLSIPQHEQIATGGKEGAMITVAFVSFTQAGQRKEDVRAMARTHLRLAQNSDSPLVIDAMIQVASSWLRLASEIEGRPVNAEEVLAQSWRAEVRPMH
jgi:hypothetical protein